jgi:hypothetical protein
MSGFCETDTNSAQSNWIFIFFVHLIGKSSLTTPSKSNHGDNLTPWQAIGRSSPEKEPDNLIPWAIHTHQPALLHEESW